ncbi:MAG: serine hydrolase [Cytophagales bacterium]|nr:serine hydrolase [Cytophagales bacterium]
MKKAIAASILCLWVNIHGFSQSSYTYSTPKALNDGWETASLYELEFTPVSIEDLFEQLHYESYEIHSVVVIHKNQLIIEEYFDGYTVDQPHDLRSVTKSIRSLLLGIALDQGFIKSIDDPISTYLKSHVPRKNLTDSKEKITIRHLITMSSGLDCNDWDQQSKGREDKVYKKKDWIQYTLNLPMIHEPGEVSAYCSMGTILLAEIISQASGMSLQAFAQQYLFNPLDISNVKWGHTSDKEVIESGKRLYMTPRDMAKIGQLILNKGKWQGKQVISEQWIQDATSSKTKITGINYGYLWWNLPFQTPQGRQVSKTATGNGGQYIMSFPELELVVIFTGGAYNSEKDKIPFAIVRDVILPTFSE